MLFGLLLAQGYSQESESGRSNIFDSNSSISVSTGVLVLPNRVGITPIVNVNFRIINICDRRNKNRPAWCYFSEIDISRIWRHRDPWKDIPPILVLPEPFPEPDPGPLPWENFRISELEVGASTLFNPVFGADIGLRDRLGLSLSGGVGFKFTEGNETKLNEGVFRTTQSTSPLVTYGADLRLGLTKSLSAKVGVRGLTTFEGNMDVIGPDGSIATFEGGTMTAPMATLGLGYSF